jgi:probable rRNA maturation factor
MGHRKQTQNITVQITKNFDSLNVNASKLKKLVKAVCNRYRLREAVVGIAIVDDSEIRKVNKRFCNNGSSTDCLSFDLSDDDPDSAKLFELIVNAERAVKEAHSRGHSPQAELALYVTHALLHNLGFGDSDPKLAKKMHDTEDEILQQFGFGSVYNT